MNDFDLTLDECLQELTAGTSTLDQCLARHPQQAAELRPLLTAALRLQKGKAIQPSEAFKDRSRAALAEHMRSHPRRPRKPRTFPKLALSMVALVLALLVVSTAFAQSALPGEALYTWKLSTERAWRATSPDPVEVDLSLTDRRTDELLTIAAAPGRTGHEDESAGIAAYNDVLGRLAKEADGPDGGQILTALQSHQEKLSDAGIHVPELDNIVAHGNPGNGQGHGQGNKP